jgi:hypothetical protein
VTLSLDQVVETWEQRPRSRLHSSTFALAEVALDVESDDPALFGELSVVLGAAPAPAAPHGRLGAAVRAHDAPGGLGHLRLDVDLPDQLTPSDFLLGLQSPEFPFHLLDPQPDGPTPWTRLAFRGQHHVAFALRGRDCLFGTAPLWRTAVSLFLFQRLMRLRSDAVFFHASTVALHGRGLMFVGHKGAGKSTLALALAARGVPLLGDENACYLPERRELQPVLRPLGVKPGPRSRRVRAALERLGRDPDREGPLRIPAEALFPDNHPAPAPLHAVVFLGPFAAEPRLSPVEAGRDELADLQPVGSSLVNAPAARRVFEMARLLSAAETYRLQPGDPDATADLVYTHFGGDP